MNRKLCPSCKFEVGQGHSRFCLKGGNVEAELDWFRRREEYVQKLSQAVAEVRRPLIMNEVRGREVIAFVASAHDALMDFEGDDPRPE